MPSSDIEKKDVGNNPAGSTTDKTNAPGSHDQSTHAKNLEKLRTFQDLVGIRTPAHILSTGTIPGQELIDLEKQAKANFATIGTVPTHDLAKGRPQRNWKDLFFRRTVANDGIYGRSIDEALRASIGYNLSNAFINSLYVIQIFVAATITGLASYHGHEIPLTVLGAVNAVLAGLMALLKGQGLPVRLRRSRDQFQNVMKSIENAERMFSRYLLMTEPIQNLHDPFTEAALLEELFDAAKKDEQANYPDLYSNQYERDALDAINTNNRVGGPGIFGDTTVQDIQDQNLKLKTELDAIRATLAANNLKVAATDANATKQ